MKHISIIIPRGHTSVVNIGGTYQILNMVNEILGQMGKPAVFDVHLVGLEKETRQTTGIFSVTPDLLLEEVEKTDLIIIPAIHDDPGVAKEKKRPLFPGSWTNIKTVPKWLVCV